MHCTIKQLAEFWLHSVDILLLLSRKGLIFLFTVLIFGFAAFISESCWAVFNFFIPREIQFLWFDPAVADFTVWLLFLGLSHMKAIHVCCALWSSDHENGKCIVYETSEHMLKLHFRYSHKVLGSKIRNLKFQNFQASCEVLSKIVCIPWEWSFIMKLAILNWKPLTMLTTYLKKGNFHLRTSYIFATALSII